MILVTGATGKVGAELVKRLRQRGVPFRVASRSSSPQKNGDAEAVRFDFDRPETFGPALSGIEKLFLLTSGGTEREGPVVEAAKKAGVRRVVKLSVWSAEQEAFAFGRAHRAIEKKIEASGLPYTFLRPNGFMQNFSTAIAPSIKSQGAFYFPGDFRHSIIDVRDVAAVAARALTDDGAHSGKAYQLSGPESLSNVEIAEKLAAATGKKVTFVEVAEADFKKALLSAGVPEPYADAYIDLIRYYQTGAGEAITPDVEQVTGRPPTTFDRFARDHVSAWK